MEFYENKKSGIIMHKPFPEQKSHKQKDTKIHIYIEITKESLYVKYLNYLEDKTFIPSYKSFLKNLNQKGIKYLSENVIPFNLKLLGYIDNTIRLYSVELKLSSIHNIGVFARREIHVGELITLFPVNFYYFRGDLNITSALITIYDIKPNFNHFDYCIHLNKNIIAIGDPNIKDNPAYFGHYINDGFKLKDGNIDIYNKISQKRANCKIEVLNVDIPLYIQIIATADIKIGEEILLHYGVEYWRDKM